MRAVDIIRDKRDGKPLSPVRIQAFINGVTRREWPDYQAAALLMAIVLRGMDANETAALTAAMVHSGTKLDWSDLPLPAVDKHSTGGVGDKTSLILAPIAACCGVVVPMMSGRGLGHTGGTLDKLESIPGFRVGLSLDELRRAMRATGCALIGQTAQIAPADKILYALRDVTATVESIPLIAASIMSKKIAEGIKGLIMDVKFGSGAFMKTTEQARALAHAMIAIGKSQKVHTRALLTNMDAPLGQAAGNAIEVRESIEILKGVGPADVRELSLELAAHMIHLGHAAASLEEARTRAIRALDSGQALEKFRAVISQQGGDPRVIEELDRLPSAPLRHLVRAERSGYVQRWECENVGLALLMLGAGRNRVEDSIDHAVGGMVIVRPGDSVKTGDPLIELYYRDPDKLGPALALLEDACIIGEEPPTPMPLILDLLE